MFFQQQVKHPRWKNKVAVGVKHLKIHQGVIIDMNVNVVNMIIMTSLLHIKKKERSPLRTQLDVLLATWRKTMLLGINHDKNKSKLPKLVAQTKFHNQTRHLNNRKSNAIIT